MIHDLIFPSNLFTPLGEILVLIDGKPYEYTARSFIYDRPPVEDQPLVASFRISVPSAGSCEIVCKLVHTELSDYTKVVFVCHSEVLPPVSFRLHLTMDALALS